MTTDLSVSPCRKCPKNNPVNFRCRNKCKALDAYRKQSWVEIPERSYAPQYETGELAGLPKTWNPKGRVTDDGKN